MSQIEHAEHGFGAVIDVFQDAVADYPGGAALSIRVGGQTVVDATSGWADAARTIPWREDTSAVVFSCTKGLLAILAAQLVQAGRLDYNELVTEYWPEYGAEGKARTRVSDLLSHRAGLSAPHEDWTQADICDWERTVSALAAQRPLWEPGSAYNYHPITFGWLGGEIVRRIGGASVGEQFADRVARPLSADAWIGLPDAQAHRVADSLVGPTLAEHTSGMLAALDDGSNPWPARGMTLGGALPGALVGPGEGFNDPVVRRAEIPGAGGIATAHALASIWSATVVETEGHRLLNDATLDEALAPRSEGEPVFAAPGPYPRWGMGFQLDSEARRYLTPRSFGHDGAGGQAAFADPDHGIGFAFVTSAMEAGDDRATRMIDALRTAL
ncbi:CubicO group peptidase (beta-lactamase class C family) [Microbacterium endophyticum]|uniref:CubicO group peptidase (Beta-lactamase class C family) n=1 Tax=Microbacterium endophyticum TaxID=1526412 RepID=A0A7W4V5C8_9MICO|nr:serine hydrolase domain-containing protein [Microbacterium endophyticum]MBB2977136.1 CubicO group peptidase (beta-lactamase class C family) [Microbacterium endophyticum]NIK36064.1 CubicO group peptidase (beta-lactamase class C family) [Microbacterium endophyticum]